MRKMIPESTGKILSNEILVWKCISEGEGDPSEHMRVPTATYIEYKKGQAEIKLMVTKWL